MSARTLWIWSREPADLAPIKRAKAKLDLDYNVVPKDQNPYTDARVLAIGTPPPYVGCPYFLVSETASDDEWLDALTWVLGEDEDWQATEVIDIFRSVFGAATREILSEELASEQKLSDYLNYRD